MCARRNKGSFSIKVITTALHAVKCKFESCKDQNLVLRANLNGINIFKCATRVFLVEIV